MKYTRAHIASTTSFLQFVYPFYFEPRQPDFSSLTTTVVGKRLSAANGKEFSVWETRTDLKFEEILTYVSTYIGEFSAAETVPTAAMFRLSGAAINHPSNVCGLNGDMTALHISMDHASVPDAVIKIEEVKLDLFRLGIGFLTFQISLRPEDSPDRWLDFIHEFRHTKNRVRIYDLDHAESNLQEIINHLLNIEECFTSLYPALAPYRMLPFIALYCDNMDQDAQGEFLYKARNFFRSNQEINPSDMDLATAEHPDVLQYGKNCYFTFSLRGATFVAFDAPVSQDSSQVAVSPHRSTTTMAPDTSRPVTPAYFRDKLPNEHLKQTYFLLFQIALLQKLTLNHFSEVVAKHWELPPFKNAVATQKAWHEAKEKEREDAFDSIRSTMLSFMARGNFIQVTQDAAAHRVYLKWRDTFQVDQLYREVLDQIQEMYQYLLLKRTERLRSIEEATEQRQKRREGLITIIGGTAGGSAWILTATGTNQPRLKAAELGIAFALIGIGAASLSQQFVNSGFDRPHQDAASGLASRLLTSGRVALALLVIGLVGALLVALWQ